MRKDKPHLNIVVIGHEACGKSTTTGHLLYKCGAVERRTIEKLEKKCIKMRRPTRQYAWILDKLKYEREQCTSIDISLWKFETSKFDVTIIDAPGSRLYTRNVINGISIADCAILIISAAADEFEVGLQKNGQTYEHSLLAFTFGVHQLIVAVNEMDVTNPPYSENRFNEIKTKLSSFLKRIGYKPDAIAFIPISGWHGDNLVENSSKMPWFKEWTITRKQGNAEGNCLIDAINAFYLPMRPSEKPLRLTVVNVFQIAGVGTVPIGRVETGVLKPNMMVTIAPANITAKVKSVEMHHEALQEAFPGDCVGFNVSGVSVNDLHPGYVVGDSENNPPKGVADFIAQIVVVNYCKKIWNGYTPAIHCHTAQGLCKFVYILEKVNRHTGKIIERNPKFIENGDAATVHIAPLSPICIEAFDEFSPLGRFVLREHTDIVAVGIVKSVSFIDVDAGKVTRATGKATSKK